MGSASRTKQRRLERLQEDVDRVLDGDRAFFNRHPHRHHRLRLAGQAEIRMLQEVHGAGQLRIPPNQRWYCAVKALDPEARIRNFVANDADLDVDIPEDQAAWLFNHLAPPDSQAAKAEASVRAMLIRWRAGR